MYENVLKLSFEESHLSDDLVFMFMDFYEDDVADYLEYYKKSDVVDNRIALLEFMSSNYFDYPFKKIRDYEFEGCEDLLSVVIPNGIVSIGNGAFEGCTSLHSVEISDSVICIENGAFEGCSSLKKIYLQNRVEYIGNCAFACCSRLATIRIPNSVEKIGKDAFLGCDNLRGIWYDGTVHEWGSIGSDIKFVTVNCLDGTFLQS